jgi:UDP-N-acetylmuramoyl-tripeptide--D-alanyl-D-alanine ligase
MTGGELRTMELGDRTFIGVSTDSRTIAEGQLFFAIRGERNDGHKHLDQVISRRAAGVVTEKGYFADKPLPSQVAVVEVADTHATMIKLASEYLQSTKAKRLGITGSNGKTTTKEFAYRLLSACSEKVYRSPGNFNNLFGIPLALFAMPDDTQFALLEMGVSVPGEMARLAPIIKPHIMTVTNVGPTHLEFLKTVTNVAREKLQAMKFAAPEGVLIINADDPVLTVEARKARLCPITFGIEDKADYRPDSVARLNGATTVTIEKRIFRLPLFGHYQVYNLLAAYAIARTAGCSFESVNTENIVLGTVAMRGEKLEAHGITFVADCYNANPESINAGLASFARMSGGQRKIVILGDMLELGADAVRYHNEVGAQLATFSFDLILAVGPLSKYVIENAAANGISESKLHHFNDAGACAEACGTLLVEGDLVYLKGSRGIGLEAVLKRFTNREGEV